jgi:hypothetical protein
VADVPEGIYEPTKLLNLAMGERAEGYRPTVLQRGTYAGGSSIFDLRMILNTFTTAIGCNCGVQTIEVSS